jgi:hypothetical protein
MLYGIAKKFRGIMRNSVLQNLTKFRRIPYPSYTVICGKNRTTRTGQPKQDGQNRTVVNRTARSGHLDQDSQNRKARTGKSEQDSKE